MKRLKWFGGEVKPGQFWRDPLYWKAIIQAGAIITTAIVLVYAVICLIQAML